MRVGHSRNCSLYSPSRLAIHIYIYVRVSVCQGRDGNSHLHTAPSYLSSIGVQLLASALPASVVARYP